MTRTLVPTRTTDAAGAAPTRAVRRRPDRPRLVPVTLHMPVRRRHRASGCRGRQRCSSNGRQILATLTDKGYEVLKEAAPGHVEQVRSTLFDQLTPEQVRALQDIFQTVLHNLEDLPPGCTATNSGTPDLR
jgi:hypothetical protein